MCPFFTVTDGALLEEWFFRHMLLVLDSLGLERVISIFSEAERFIKYGFLYLELHDLVLDGLDFLQF